MTVSYVRLVALILAPLALLTLYGGAALAEAPANDDIANAVDVTSLPFAHTVDITEATYAADDLQCGTLPGDHSVWYKITPSSDARLGIHVETEVDELSVSIFDGSSIMLYCSYSYDNALETTGRTTYYIQLATCCGAGGGPVTISMQEVKPLSADIHVDHQGQINAGLVHLSGKLRCSRKTSPGSELVVQGTLTQGQAQGWLVPVHFGDGCPDKWMPWSTTVQVLSVAGFQPGKAALTATVFACSEFDTCAEPVTKTIHARLR